MKHCAKCGDPKSDDSFYSNDRTCKECRKRMVKENRSAKIDYYREYDRRRSNNPDRVLSRAEYAKSTRGQEAFKRAKQRYIERNPERDKVRTALSNAIRDKKIWKSPCCMAPGCFSTKNIQGHHPDYDQPLSVVWLCSSCHMKLHFDFTRKQRAAA